MDVSDFEAEATGGTALVVVASALVPEATASRVDCLAALAEAARRERWGGIAFFIPAVGMSVSEMASGGTAQGQTTRADIYRTAILWVTTLRDGWLVGRCFVVDSSFFFLACHCCLGLIHQRNNVDCPCPTTTIEARGPRDPPPVRGGDRLDAPPLLVKRNGHPLCPNKHRPPGHPGLREAPPRVQAPAINNPRRTQRQAGISKPRPACIARTRTRTRTHTHTSSRILSRSTINMYNKKPLRYLY